MSLSFRTNGNFIDFVNTDATSLNVETVLMKLHNTSRCIDWSLPEDTTRISFTIDEVKYSNIPITSIDFDGTVMNSQDDFETGITAMFTGLAQGGGSGGGVESVTYQNNAMSSPVKAFVFKDESNNIYRVYEPIRNNDVSRSELSYADSIDLFQFDNEEWFDNTLSDVKLIDIPTDAEFYNNSLKNLVIDVNSKTGLKFERNTMTGKLGENCPNNAEVYIVGNSVLFRGVFAKGGYQANVYFDSLGESCQVDDCFCDQSTHLLFNGNKSCSAYYCYMSQRSSIDFKKPGSAVNYTFLQNNATIEATGTHENCSLDTNSFVSAVDGNTFTISYKSGTTLGVDGDHVSEFFRFIKDDNVSRYFNIASITHNGVDDRTEFTVSGNEFLSEVQVGDSIISMIGFKQSGGDPGMENVKLGAAARIEPSVDNVKIGRSELGVSANISIGATVSQKYYRGTELGLTTTFLDADGNTVSITQGIITAITPP